MPAEINMLVRKTKNREAPVVLRKASSAGGRDAGRAKLQSQAPKIPRSKKRAGRASHASGDTHPAESKPQKRQMTGRGRRSRRREQGGHHMPAEINILLQKTKTRQAPVVSRKASRAGGIDAARGKLPRHAAELLRRAKRQSNETREAAAEDGNCSAMKRAASSLHASGDEHPAAENQNDDLLLVVDGGVPSELNDKVVSMNSPCAFDELNDVFVAAATYPVVCGFDCASDVRKLAGKHESLTFASMTKGGSSWQLLYDRRTWSVIKELKLEQVWPMRHFRVGDRYAAVCELKRYDREADAVSKKARSDAAQLAARIVMFKCIRGKAKCTRWRVNYETR